MTPSDKLLRNVNVVFGFVSLAFFGFDFFVFAKLRPRMVAFETVSPAEEGLLTWVGVGLLLLLIFYLLSLFRLAQHLKKAQRITPLSIVLLVGGILSFIFVFSDVALLSDIDKQYRHGLTQPEWLLVYPIMGGQLITTVAFTYLHLFGFRDDSQVGHVARDSNIFLIVQYVGIICGLMGLALASLGFVFSHGWNLHTHTTITSIILLMPYALSVGYWLVTKLQEEHRQWYDEKQLQDVGKSAFLALGLSVVAMTGLFVANYNNLTGIVSALWLPFYLFLVVFLFSSGNLYFSSRS